MGVQVTFDPAAWFVQFPEFVPTVTTSQANALAAVVGATLTRNDGGGPASNVATQTQLLFYAVAHMAFIQYGTTAQPPGQIVGRINSATEGSVSVGTDLGPVFNSQAFWAQTKYGEIYWQMTAPYRTMRYMPAPGYCANPFGSGVANWNYPNWWQ